jgi:hypothetical protein
VPRLPLALPLAPVLLLLLLLPLLPPLMLMLLPLMLLPCLLLALPHLLPRLPLQPTLLPSLLPHLLPRLPLQPTLLPSLLLLPLLLLLLLLTPLLLQQLPPVYIQESHLRLWAPPSFPPPHPPGTRMHMYESHLCLWALHTPLLLCALEPARMHMYESHPSLWAPHYPCALPGAVLPRPLRRVERAHACMRPSTLCHPGKIRPPRPPGTRQRPPLTLSGCGPPLFLGVEVLLGMEVVPPPPTPPAQPRPCLWAPLPIRIHMYESHLCQWAPHTPRPPCTLAPARMHMYESHPSLWAPHYRCTLPGAELPRPLRRVERIHMNARSSTLCHSGKVRPPRHR